MAQQMLTWGVVLFGPCASALYLGTSQLHGNRGIHQDLSNLAGTWGTFDDKGSALVKKPPTRWSGGVSQQISEWFGGGDDDGDSDKKEAEESRDMTKSDRTLHMYKCGESHAGSVHHPQDIQCPTECPYLRVDPTHFCHFACVPADRCNSDDPLANYANPRTRRCEMCMVPACAHCVNSSDTCERCQEGFELVGQECLSLDRFTWYIVYVVLGVFSIAGLVYLIVLKKRPEVSREVLEQAVRYRGYAKVRNPHNDNRLFSLFHTNLRQHSATGTGVLLHFNWQMAIIVWVMMITVILFMVRVRFPTRPEAIKEDLGSDGSFDACRRHVSIQMQRVFRMEQHYFWVVFGIYVGTTLGSIYMARWLQDLFEQRRSEDITVGQYALYIKGLPRDLNAKTAESDLTQFLRQEFPTLDILGVSICWDLTECHGQLVERLRSDLEILDLETPVRQKLASDSRWANTVSPRSGCLFDLRCVDAIFGFGGGCGGQSNHFPTSQNEAVKILENLKTAGRAFIIFNTRSHCEEAVKLAKDMTLEYQGARLQVKERTLEPDTVLWENFGVPHNAKVKRMIAGTIAVLILIGVLDYCLYTPYVRYIMQYNTVAGKTEGELEQGLLLSLLITLDNQIIYAIIQIIVDRIGFNFKSDRDVFHVIFYTFAVFVNVMVDMWTVLILTRGYSMVEAASLQLSSDTVLSPKAIAEHPALQRELFNQILAYLYPGTLLLPFLLEPLMVALLPYHISKWLIRSRTDITVPEAEECLSCPPFDLLRYGDILINVMICNVMLAFTYRDLWHVFFFLLLSGIVIYIWDVYRLLRLSTRRFFPAFTMARVVCYLMSAPCAILGMVIIWRIFAAKDDGFLDGPVNDFDRAVHDMDAQTRVPVKTALRRGQIIASMCLFGLCHVVLHCLAVKLVLSRKPRKPTLAEESKPYAVVAKHTSCSLFTSNPAHCAKSKYLWKHSPPCLYHLPGKDYLMEPNPQQHLYYEGLSIQSLDSERSFNAENYREGMRRMKSQLLDSDFQTKDLCDCAGRDKL